MQNEGVDRIVDPEQFPVLSGQRAGGNVAARIIGPQFAADDAANDVFAALFGVETPQVDAHKIVR